MFTRTARHTSILAIAAIAGLTLAGCSAPSDGDGSTESITLRLAHIYPETEPATIELKNFADKVAEATDGRITIEIFPGGQLGTEAENLEGVRAGTLDMTLGSAPFADVPSLQVELAPYLFDSNEGAVRALRSDVAQELLWTPMEEQTGLVAIDSWMSGFGSFTSNKAFDSPETLAGIKVRTPDLQTGIDMVEAMGGVSVPIAFTELYVALQTNVVEAQYNPLPRNIASNFQEVQKYLVLTNHIASPLTFQMTRATLDKLSEEDQATIIRLVRESGDAATAAYQANDDELLERVTSEGLFEVIEPDNDAFRAAIEKNFLPKYESFYGEGVYQKLRDAQKG